MAFQMGEETRQVQGTWAISQYKFRIESSGLKLLCDGMKEKKLLGIRCSQCGTVYIPGPFYCRKCLIEINEVVEVEPTGTVMSYAAEMADVRGNLLEEIRITAMIKPDGADTWMIGRIMGIDWKKMKVGMRVKVVWVDEPQGNFGDIARYEPLAE
ncbi:MAG: hypothetical protein PHP64_03725 [Actinomycetota bacterium]|nr:hypothetical protein [Actinomycetota bacterium]